MAAWLLMVMRSLPFRITYTYNASDGTVYVLTIEHTRRADRSGLL